MAKNAYGQEDPLCDMAYWNERSNTHQNAPISKSSEEAGDLPAQTPRTSDAEMPSGRRKPQTGNEY
jgi:hypothetical protein